MNNNSLATEILAELKKRRNAWRFATLSLIAVNVLTVFLFTMR